MKLQGIILSGILRLDVFCKYFITIMFFILCSSPLHISAFQLLMSCGMFVTKLSLKCQTAPKKNPFFNDSEAKIKRACELSEKAEVSIFTFQKCRHLESGRTRSKPHPGEPCRGSSVGTANSTAGLFKTRRAASCHRRYETPFWLPHRRFLFKHLYLAPFVWVMLFRCFEAFQYWSNKFFSLNVWHRC